VLDDCLEIPFSVIFFSFCFLFSILKKFWPPLRMGIIIIIFFCFLFSLGELAVTSK
jgi:hypothetical protein